MLENNSLNLAQIVGSEPIICREHNGVEPELRLVTVCMDMHVRRL